MRHPRGGRGLQNPTMNVAAEKNAASNQWPKNTIATAKIPKTAIPTPRTIRAISYQCLESS